MEVNNILVSIVVPIYNVEKYLRKCLDSILNQTYKNIEILLIDDGSTDLSGSICDEYKTKDNRIKVIHKANGGLSSARNFGIDIANGEYICFIDSDDFLHKEYVSRLLNVILENNADIAECNVIKVDENEVFNFEFKENQNKDILVLNGEEGLRRIHDEDFLICLRSVLATNKLYKISLFKNIRYTFGKLHEDEFTSFRLYYESSKIVFIQDELYAYLQRKNSIMHKEFSIKRFDALEAYDNYMSFFIDKEMEDMQARTCRRYLRLLGIIKNEVKNSKYEDKENAMKVLNDKFEYVCNFLNELVKKHPELEKWKNLSEEFIKIYNEV